jgi:ATP-dependent Clp protease adapter protein ClpS
MSRINDRKILNPGVRGVNLDSVLGEWRVKAFNNNTTSYEAVVRVLMQDCGYDHPTADGYTRKIHHEGQCTVFWGNEQGCKRICGALEGIGVKAEMEKNA